MLIPDYQEALLGYEYQGSAFLRAALVQTLRAVLVNMLESFRTMMQENMQTLLQIARWVQDHKPHIMRKVRQIAGTEENYLIIARELDRVNAQIAQARAVRAEATLTLLDWLIIVDSYHWKCAYCQEKPFEVMYHHVPLPRGGTTSTNCVPACCRCRVHKKKRALATVSVEFHNPSGSPMEPYPR